MPLIWNILVGVAISITTVILGFVGWYKWMTRSKRGKDSGYEYVMVNEDGSAREVTSDEREYLETEFHPADGGRPYIKFRYESVDGWNSLAGFLSRRQLPIEIQLLEAIEEGRPSELESILDTHRQAGDTVVENGDGSISVSPSEHGSSDE